ncbi:MAG TPA: ABC transporter permease [Candidatus Limnocylindrales bacterium]|nr:ABC transporter permease [Candidatus Limnocylindrales bacterium]
MKLARDTWLILQYEAGLLIKNPVNIAISLVQPLTYLLLFTPFLGSVMEVPEYGNAFEIYVPSLMSAMGLFSGLFAGFAMLASIRQGVVNRCRVTPLSRVGLVLGRELLYVLLTGFQAIVVTVTAFAFGLRVPPINFLFALGILSLMVLISVAISYCLALLMPTENSLVQLINGISNPLSLLAGVLIPLSVAPLWIQNVALWNPFAWGTNGMRAIFQGQLGNAVVWQSALILTVLAVLAVGGSSRMFTRSIA